MKDRAKPRLPETRTSIALFLTNLAILAIGYPNDNDDNQILLRLGSAGDILRAKREKQKASRQGNGKQ